MRHALQFAILALSALDCLPAHADEAIVVTATRSPAPAATLPARVEVIGRADIEAHSMTTLAEAIGPQAVQAGGAGQQTSVFLRGANSKHALALFDGVRLNDAASPNGQYDFGQDTLGGLDRVEVLRGPASAVYGSDAIGGVVNMLPRRGGAAAFEPFAEASTGSFETRRALVGVAGSAGGFDYGISGEVFETDGHDLVPARMATHSGDRDATYLSTLTASLRHQSGAFAWDALLRVRESETEFDTFSGGPFMDLRADDSDLENTGAQRLWRLGAEMDAGAALTVRLAGGQVLSERAETDGGGETSSADSTRDFADISGRYRFEAGSLNAGLSFERNHVATRTQFASPLATAESQAAAYLLAQFPLGRRVTATGSLRVDNYQNFGAHTTYAVGAVADLAPLRLFASIGAAFKAPSLSERFETSSFNLGNRNLRPEQSQSWEIGADWSAWETVSLGASYYKTRIADLIEYDFLQLKNLNVGEASIDGAEIYAQAAVAPWASLRASYTWTDARDAATGAPLARRPAHAWRLDVRVRPHERLALALSWSYFGARTDVAYANSGAFESGAGRAEAFNVGALSASFDLTARTQAFARIDNITDAAYEQPAAFAGAPRGGSIGIRTRF